MLDPRMQAMMAQMLQRGVLPGGPVPGTAGIPGTVPGNHPNPIPGAVPQPPQSWENFIQTAASAKPEERANLMNTFHLWLTGQPQDKIAPVDFNTINNTNRSY